MFPYSIMNSLSSTFLRLKPLFALQHSSRVRLLYSAASIGMEDYISARKSYESKTSFDASKFRSKMKQTCDSNENDLVFTDDLKQMAHIVNQNEEDMLLMEKMMIKFHSHTSHLRFSSFVFGPVIMRTYHYLNKPHEALKAFKNEKLQGFFDQLSTHIILMDLLFKNEMYSEILDVYQIFREKQLGFGKYPKSMMVLMFAAYYKLNTLEHFKKALQLYEELNKSGNAPLRRSVCFVAALALNQNDPNASLEIISSLPSQEYVLVRCIKVLALCELGKQYDALSTVKSILLIDRPGKPKNTLPIDVIERIQNTVEKLDSKQALADWNRIKNQLKEQDHIVDKTFDEILCSEIIVTAPARRTDNILNAAMSKPAYSEKYKFRLAHRAGSEDTV